VLAAVLFGATLISGYGYVALMAVVVAVGMGLYIVPVRATYWSYLGVEPASG
jgi:hypothetical protein